MSKTSRATDERTQRRVRAASKRWSLPEATDARPDPSAPVARALAPLWWSALVVGLALGGLTLGAETWTGHAAAALLAGVPSLAILGATILGRAQRRRRVAMILATTAAGLLALATISSVGAPTSPAHAYQLACFAASGALLTAAWPCWRRANREGDEADALLRMYEEL